MEAELIKEGNFYKLIQNNTILAKISTNESIDIHYSFGKLSLKNCQAVANGYDLDELSDENTSDCDASGCYPEDVFKDGFKKALEILGDKKFSSRNMLKAFITGVFTDETSDYDFEFTELMQDLQQTEWDVDIVMEGFVDDEGIYCGEKPLLDADGCLILKRKI